MDSIIQFTVNDTSPTVSYSGNWIQCFTDIGCEGQNWTQTQKPTPTGFSYHVTSNDRANFTLKWRGTGVLLRGAATNLSCVNYTILLDDKEVQSPQANLSQNVLASIQNVTLQDHTVKLVVSNPSSKDINISYTGAVIYVDDTAAGYTTVSLNETAIDYSGNWSDYGQYKHSTTPGDVAHTLVQGLSFFLYGMTTPSSGPYSVSLTALTNHSTIHRRFIPDYTSTNFSGNSAFHNPDALLFYADDLDPTVTYNLTVTNEGESDLFIKSDGFQVFQSKLPPTTTPLSSTSPMSSLSTGTSAAIALAAVLFVLIAALFLLYFLVYRPRYRRCREEFDALKAGKAIADEEEERRRDRDTIMHLEEARISQSSSYRRRLARIISMMTPGDLGKPLSKPDSQLQPPLSPISPASTHRSDYILEISRRASQKRNDRQFGDIGRYNDLLPTEEGGTILVHVPTSTIESEPQGSTNARVEDSAILHPRSKSSPEATIPVSPSVSSGAGTQHRRGRGSQNSSQLRSGRFSLPFSLSIPYVHTRSPTEDGNGEPRNGPRSKMGHLPRGESGRRSDGQGSDGTSLSTIIFAEDPKVPTTHDGVKPKSWNVRKTVQSFMTGLGSVGKRWSNTRTSTRAGDVIYPFVGVSATVPTRRGPLSAGGGLLIIGRDGDGAADNVESPGADSQREENGGRRSPPTGTDITPLSYASRSGASFPAGEVEPQSEEQGPVEPPLEPSSVATAAAVAAQPPYSFSHHPYAAAALLSGPEESRTDVVALQAALSIEGSQQRPQTAPTPSKVGFRQLPVIPRAPQAVHSDPPPARPHTTDGPVSVPVTGHDATTTTSGRAIRALPPLPVPAPKPTVQVTSSSVEKAHEAHAAEKSPLSAQSTVQDDATSLLPPYPPSGYTKGSQPSSDSELSSQSSLKPPFLNMRDISPFQVNFPYSDDEQSQNEGKTQPSMGSASTTRTRPTVQIPSSTDAPQHPPPAVITPPTARSTAQYSFLDFATTSSSSNRDSSTREKSESSPVSEVPPVPVLPRPSLDEPSRVEDNEEDPDDHSRRTFGQKRRSSGFYYNAADNISLPSPSTSSFTHQSHHTHQTSQTYQTGQSQEGQKPTSQSYQKRRHASWRATFGGRIEGHIPEEVTPSESSPPLSLPDRAPTMDPQPTTATGPPRSSPTNLALEPIDQIPQDDTQDEVRRSYMSTSSAGHSAHVHPFSVGLSGLSSRYTTQTPAQLELVSPESTDDVSIPSPIQFRTGGIRRTSSGDVQPVSPRRPTHTRDGGSSSGGSGDSQQPRHPFSIP